jgi:hypothetical protein
MKIMPLDSQKTGSSKTPYRRRSGLLTFLTIPAVCLIWLFGWSLYWIGSQRKIPPVRRIPEESATAFAVLMPEQDLATC